MQAWRSLFPTNMKHDDVVSELINEESKVQRYYGSYIATSKAFLGCPPEELPNWQ